MQCFATAAIRQQRNRYGCIIMRAEQQLSTRRQSFHEGRKLICSVCTPHCFTILCLNIGILCYIFYSICILYLFTSPGCAIYALFFFCTRICILLMCRLNPKLCISIGLMQTYYNIRYIAKVVRCMAAGCASFFFRALIRRNNAETIPFRLCTLHAYRVSMLA